MRYPEFHYVWEWRLRSTPKRLWPFVADTNRFNRDTGLPSVRPAAGGESPPPGRRWLQFTRLGQKVEWEEEPFQWVRPRRFGVVRRYRSGPVATLRAVAELADQPGGGTLLRYETWARPRTPLGLLAIPIVIGLQSRRAFGRTFRRYDDLASTEAPPTDALAKPAHLQSGGQRRIQAARRALAALADASAVDALVRTVQTADEVAAAHLRPYAIADAAGLQRRSVLEACLHGTRAGLLDLQWDVLCPLCRGARESGASLAEISGRVHCDSCNIDAFVNFDRSVELTFRPSPAIREMERRTFCVGGPQVTPHIAAQQILAPGEERPLSLALEEGRYRVRALALPGGQYFRASCRGEASGMFTATPSGWPNDEPELSLSPDIRLCNGTAAEQVFIIERMAWSDQAATAAEVINLQAFRDLFSGEVLRPGERISVGSLAVLFTDLRGSTRLYRQIGDAPAFGRVLDHFQTLKEAISAEHGALIKTIGDAVMATFTEPVGALRAILQAQDRLLREANGEAPLLLKAGIHYGPCIAVTMNGRLDYFGSAVNMAARLERFSTGIDVIISEAVRTDPEVDAFVADPGNGLAAERFEAQLAGFDNEEFALWRVARVMGKERHT